MSSDWSTVTIGSVLANQFSGAWGIEPTDRRVTSTVLRATDIDDQGHVNLETGAQRALSARDRDSKALAAGDIILEASGGGPGKPVGRPAWFPGDAVRHYAASNFFKVLRPDRNQIDGRFLLWKLLELSHSPKIWMFQQQTTGIINLKFRDYLKFTLQIPARPEQERIAEILDAVDEQIRTSRVLIDKIRAFKSGVVDQLIAHHPPHAVLSDALAGSPSNGIYKPAELIGRGTLLIGQTAFTPDRTVDPDLARRAVVSNSERSRFEVKVGDILVSRVFATLEGVGQPALVDVLPEPAVYESNMMRLQLDIRRADSLFIFSQLQIGRARAHVTRRANLSNQASISQSVLTQMPFWLPSLEVQRGISAAIAAVDRRYVAERQRLAKLETIKEGLISDLLNGRVRAPAKAGS